MGMILNTTSERLVWIYFHRRDAIFRQISEGASAIVPGSATWCETNNTQLPGYHPCPRQLHHGMFPGGALFFVYRIALDIYGIKEHKYISVVQYVYVCSMIPMAMYPDLCQSLNGVRVLSVRSDLDRLNGVLRIITDEVVTVAVEGFNGMDPFGNSVHIFSDRMDIYSFSPAFASVPACLTIVSNAFCMTHNISNRNGI